jgi:hypothetical protein
VRRASVTLLLLAIFLGMSAGPHPCHAAEKASSVTTEHASCHGAQTPVKAPQPRDHDCCDPVKGGHVLCDQACQGAAVIGVAPALPEILSFQELGAPVSQRPAALFVLAIDHVPLS